MPAPEPIPDLLKAVNEARGKAFALWVMFLTVGTYLAVAIAWAQSIRLAPRSRSYYARTEPSSELHLAWT